MLRKKNKIEEGTQCWGDRGFALLFKVIWESLSDKTFDRDGEEVKGHTDIWGSAFQQESTASAKALG